jgi:ABC-type transport system substrate-binding protein
LYGRYVASSGRDVKSVKLSPEFQRLVDWYLELRSSVDKERRLEMGHNILGQWAEECYAVGICRPQVLTIINKRFRNVPDHIIHDYRIYTPGYIGIEQFYFEGGSNQ